MRSVSNQLMISATLAIGLALTPVVAQHGTHEHGQKDASAKEPPKCPVMGEPLNLAVSVATDEGPVFFCCKDCISTYQSNPAKYAAKVAAQRKALADRPKIQVTCPISKEPVDPNVFIESEGRKVFFCCKGCMNKYKADPTKYASALANSYTFQIQCPVMKEEINPKSFSTAGNGMKIYFCCKGCDRKFFADPAKYAPNLVAQGFTINPKEMTHGSAGDEKGHEHGADGHGGHDHDH